MLTNTYGWTGSTTMSICNVKCVCLFTVFTRLTIYGFIFSMCICACQNEVPAGRSDDIHTSNNALLRFSMFIDIFCCLLSGMLEEDSS